VKSEELYRKSILKDKSFDFAVQIVKLTQQIDENNKNYVLTRQILRSGTAIGALISEAAFAQSRADFVSKMSIALKANETYYWIKLLFTTNYIEKNVYEILLAGIDEIISLLVSTIKTAKQNENKITLHS
jgi:four helix bundle protein